MIYLYCLLPGEIEVSTDGLMPMDEGQPVYLLKEGQLQAAVSEVGEEFAEANLNSRVRDLDWLSPRAVRHHDVVDALFTRCRWLLPLTFGAIFRSEDTLLQRLREGQKALRQRLDELHDREEWDAKLSREEAQFSEQLASQSPSLRQAEIELTSKPPGTRFLLEKKLQNLRTQEAKQLSAHIRADVQKSLAAAAIEARLDEVAPTSGQATKLEMRGAYLVDRGEEAPLKAAAQRMAERYAPLGYKLEVTGPWPAFSFASGLQESLV